jgi:prepilin-type N-terminal cleavage/methylation domain-containing protein
MRHSREERGFTLLELMVALTIFALITAGTATVFISVQRAWKKEKSGVDLLQNARWAMEFMSNELRQAEIELLTNLTLAGEEIYAIKFQPFPGPTVSPAWYWRYQSILYRGEGDNFTDAQNNSEELANFLWNDANNTVFAYNNTTGVVNIDLILEKDGRYHTLSSWVRPRQ